MATILHLPAELLTEICCYLLPRKPMDWSRLLRCGDSPPITELRHSYYYGTISNFALTCSLFYSISRQIRSSAVVAGLRMCRETQDYPDRQLLSWIHRNHKYPITFANPVKEVYIGIHDTIGSESFSPDLLELLPDAALLPGLAKPNETPSLLSCSRLSLDDRCKMAECESYLIALLLSQLRNLEDLTISTTAKALKYTSERCCPLGSPFIPSLRSVGLLSCGEHPFPRGKMELDIHTVSNFMQMGLEVSEIRIQDFRLKSVDSAVLRNMTSITLCGVDISESECYTLLRDCNRLSEFKYSTKGRIKVPRTRIGPSKIIDGLQSSRETLQTLCLDLRGSDLYYDDPISLGEFKGLENLWIGSGRAGLSQDRLSDDRNHFFSTLPASLKRLHLNTTAAFERCHVYEKICTYLERLAKECLCFSRPNFKELGLRQAGGRVGVIIETFQMAGVEVLSRADDIPMAW